MLKVMRQSFHQLKWTLFAVIIVFVVGFVFFSGGSSTGGGGLSNQTIARIGADTITAPEFDARYQIVKREQQRVYGGNLSPELVRAMNLPQQVLDVMIDNRLELEEAKRLDLRVSDEEVSSYVLSLPTFQQNGQFIGRERYQQTLAAYRLTPERFEDEIRESLLSQKYRALVKASILVAEQDVREEFAARNEKATIEYVKIPSSRLDSGTGPTEADLKTYYEKHKERYRTPEQRRVKYLLVDRARVQAKIVIPPSDLMAEYERHKESFTTGEQVTAAQILIKVDPSQGPQADALARARAQALTERAKSGADFAQLANQNTEDPSGKGNGGQLPPFSRGQMPPEFERAAFSLEPGQVGEPIKTESGYHVIKVIAKTPPHVRSFDEVRAQISSELAQKRVEAETARRARELADRVKNVKSASDEELRRLADNDTIFYNETPWFSRGESIPGVGQSSQFAEQAWALKIGQISKTPLETARGPAILKPSEVRPAGVPPLVEIKARVGLDYQAERREKEGVDKLQPAVAELNSGATLASIAKRYEAEVKTTPEFSPGGPIPEIGSAPELSKAVFSTPQGKAGAPVPVPGGFVLFRVLNHTATDPAAFRAQEAEITDNLKGREAERLVRATLQQLRTERKVEINEEALRSFLPEAKTRG